MARDHLDWPGPSPVRTALGAATAAPVASGVVSVRSESLVVYGVELLAEGFYERGPGGTWRAAESHRKTHVRRLDNRYVDGSGAAAKKVDAAFAAAAAAYASSHPREMALARRADAGNAVMRAETARDEAARKFDAAAAAFEAALASERRVLDETEEAVADGGPAAGPAPGR
jgi:hypothetical protein